MGTKVGPPSELSIEGSGAPPPYASLLWWYEAPPPLHSWDTALPEVTHEHSPCFVRLFVSLTDIYMHDVRRIAFIDRSRNRYLHHTHGLVSAGCSGYMCTSRVEEVDQPRPALQPDPNPTLEQQYSP